MAYEKSNDARMELRGLLKAYDEGTLPARALILAVNQNLVDGVLFSTLTDVEASGDILKKNCVGAPGAATGKVARSIEKAETYIDSGEKFILVLSETLPQHLHYIKKAEGVVTFNGTLSSHAMLIARQIGKPTIIGAGDMGLTSGQEISIDGKKGVIINGAQAITPPEPDNPDLLRVLEIADSITPSGDKRKMIVQANTDTAEGAKEARAKGAKGIGVVRTEHMVVTKERLPIMQAVIEAKTGIERTDLLRPLEPEMKADFKALLAAMEGLPVTIRLLDAAMHEIGGPEETNPMLGNRGIRAGLLKPEIYDVQVRCILEAAAELQQTGIDARPQIMLPLVSHAKEVELLKERIEAIANGMEHKPNYKFGVMIETMGVVEEMEAIAPLIDFASAGTNDLTQITLGLSRDDASEIIPGYIAMGIYPHNPFQTLHPMVLAKLDTAVQRGKAVNPALQVSLCGEQGGDPASIEALQGIKGEVYAVSVSPPRIPVARLATAQALVKEEIQAKETWIEKCQAAGVSAHAKL